MSVDEMRVGAGTARDNRVVSTELGAAARGLRLGRGMVGVGGGVVCGGELERFFKTNAYEWQQVVPKFSLPSCAVPSLSTSILPTVSKIPSMFCPVLADTSITPMPYSFPAL